MAKRPLWVRSRYGGRVFATRSAVWRVSFDDGLLFGGHQPVVEITVFAGDTPAELGRKIGAAIEAACKEEERP